MEMLSLCPKYESEQYYPELIPPVLFLVTVRLLGEAISRVPAEELFS